MQIACVHHKHAPSELFDVELNLAIAKRINRQEGWKPWGAYTDGSYKFFLARI